MLRLSHPPPNPHTTHPSCVTRTATLFITRSQPTYKCYYCRPRRRKFVGTAEALRIHRAVEHADVATLPADACPCGYFSADRSNRAKHARTHEEPVYVQCGVCDRSIQQQSWRHHSCNLGGPVTCGVIVEVESGAMVEETGATVGDDGRVLDMAGVAREDWKVCGTVAANKNSLASHRSNYHTRPFKPVTCPHCNARLTTKCGWDGHEHNPSRRR